MLRLLSLFFNILFLLSCKGSKKPISISIVNFKVSKGDIRAIHGTGTDTLYYADSKGNIGYTYNKGKSWSKTTIKNDDRLIPNFRSIAVNKDTIFSLSIGTPALLYKTYKDSTKLIYTESHPKTFYDSMQFFKNSKIAIAVGDPTDVCPSILISYNHGNTWEKIKCNYLPKFEEGEAFFAASNTNIKIFEKKIWLVSGGSEARVLQSEDVGLTWTIHDTPIIQGKNTQGIYSVDFYDELNGIIFGGDFTKPKNNNANKAITKDGGKTWKLISDNAGPGYKSCVKYIPNSKGKKIIAVGKTGISYSKDGGKNWIELSDESFFVIQFINESFAWLGGQGRIGILNLKQP